MLWDTRGIFLSIPLLRAYDSLFSNNLTHPTRAVITINGRVINQVSDKSAPGIEPGTSPTEYMRGFRAHPLPSRPQCGKIGHCAVRLDTVR